MLGDSSGRRGHGHECVCTQTVFCAMLFVRAPSTLAILVTGMKNKTKLEGRKKTE